ncbi:TetR/AcrR family transcriptional regulator [Paraflavitalea soli]|uniref:TetR/AcrR family transcriptional regulator n=1 Tax=Paraflavitalea soli TaxID=2315862 RepID=A0A3B7MI99_9BACT|nr:TetR/AcrR family transcriptional regulator [Paraflavitalea soli]AXY73938.1 TetR/AcrR family transcriptional regulator [Paraflavitalea soli]
MGSKERKARNRLKMHKDILHAALNIVKEEGYRSLSLRRLANNIEFSATAVYLYFKNKEALLVDLARLGYQQLNISIDINCKGIIDPRSRLKAMLRTYLDFATHEKDLYLLMQEIGIELNELNPLFPEMLTFVNSINQAITKACGKENSNDTYLKRKCYISMAIVQGLASLNLIHKDLDARSQSQMLDDAIDSLIVSLD